MCPLVALVGSVFLGGSGRVRLGLLDHMAHAQVYSALILMQHREVALPYARRVWQQSPMWVGNKFVVPISSSSDKRRVHVEYMRGVSARGTVGCFWYSHVIPIFRYC